MRELARINLDVCTTCLYAINGVDDDPCHAGEREASEAALSRDYPANADGTGWHVTTDPHRDCPADRCECTLHADHGDCDDCEYGEVLLDYELCSSGRCIVDDGGFSRSACDVCGSGLGGGRHKALAIEWARA